MNFQSHASLTLNHYFDELHSATDEHIDDNINYYNLQINNKLDNHCLIISSVASPVCQEGQSERTFPIFAFSSRFVLFFHDFSWFPPLFPDFFFRCQGWHSAPLTSPVATPLLITLTVLLWVKQSYHTSPVRRMISLAGINIPFIKYQ